MKLDDYRLLGSSGLRVSPVSLGAMTFGEDAGRTVGPAESRRVLEHYANLGGNFTPIGSASTVVAVSVMHKHGLPISFGGFVVKALPFALAHVALAAAYVLLFLV